MQKEGFLALYKGLGGIPAQYPLNPPILTLSVAVVTGIVPKMAIRFSSFELYKGLLAKPDTGKPSTGGIFLSGLGAGITEACLVVTPMDVVKIRLQAQHHSMSDPLDVPKYRNAAHAAYTVVKEEGFAALYRGVALTAVRQGTNQAVNFTAYQAFKKWAKEWQPQYAGMELPSWQHLMLGGLSGAMGPMSNAPIDTIKTRIQRTPNPSGERGFTRFLHVTKDLLANEVSISRGRLGG